MNTYSLYLNTKMPKEKHASEINPNKRARNDSIILSGNLSKLNDLLDSISSDETSFKQAIALILNKDVFKNAIAGVLVPEVTALRKEVTTLKSKVDDMEQYTRRNCLKITGVPEERNDNTDVLVMNVINNLVLKENEEKIGIKDISRSHRVGKFRPQNRPRDIIVKFVSYRDRARVYGNKRNLKAYNNNPTKKTDPIYINEALTQTRSELFRKTRELVKSRKLHSCWTYDGRIYAKLHGVHGRKIIISSVEDLDQFLDEEDDDPDKNQEQQFLASTPITDDK